MIFHDIKIVRFIYTFIHTYFMISVKDIIKINKKFDNGNIVNKGALEFAISSLKHTKDWVTQLAYLVRAILIDHVFEEGNKRTASALIISTLETHKKAYDPYNIDKTVVQIIIKNITNIAKIRRLIKHAIR